MPQIFEQIPFIQVISISKVQKYTRLKDHFLGSDGQL